VLREQTALNGICPYFTMFPLDFPLRILSKRASKGDWVLDPFCGRGTTNYAARLLGLPSLGIDSNPVAAAITASKLVNTSSADIVREAREILGESPATNVPDSEFWSWAYHPATLEAICRLREALLHDCGPPARVALRGIVLGALHGPQQKTFPGYLSNQCPRSYAPKPAYSVRFWKNRGQAPAPVDVLTLIGRRASRYYSNLPIGFGVWRLADSRQLESVRTIEPRRRIRWVITSPPYYGMRTYRPDQWLRNWFVGGPETVDYSNHDQVVHSSPEAFAADLLAVWRNTSRVCASGAQMVVRFGGISDRRANPLDIIKSSLTASGWRIRTIIQAGTASEGRRQADAFLRKQSRPLAEYDVWAVRQGFEYSKA
jgi:DNA modification methylase